MRFSQGFFWHTINPKGLVVFDIFQGLIHIFNNDFTIFQDKRHFFQFPGVFQDQGQIQGLFQVCANPGNKYFINITIRSAILQLLFMQLGSAVKPSKEYEISFFPIQ